jgi:hypothetical protein
MALPMDTARATMRDIQMENIIVGYKKHVIPTLKTTRKSFGVSTNAQHIFTSFAKCYQPYMKLCRTYGAPWDGNK